MANYTVETHIDNFMKSADKAGARAAIDVPSNADLTTEVGSQNHVIEAHFEWVELDGTILKPSGMSLGGATVSRVDGVVGGSLYSLFNAARITTTGNSRMKRVSSSSNAALNSAIQKCVMRLPSLDNVRWAFGFGAHKSGSFGSYTHVMVSYIPAESSNFVLYSSRQNQGTTYLDLGVLVEADTYYGISVQRVSTTTSNIKITKQVSGATVVVYDQLTSHEYCQKFSFFMDLDCIDNTNPSSVDLAYFYLNTFPDRNTQLPSI